MCGVVKQTMEMIASEDMPGHCASWRSTQARLYDGYVKPNKRVFDNSKISDHFAIIPTLQAPKSLSDIEAKLAHDMVVKTLLAVFFPNAEFMVTTRITKGAARPGTRFPDQRQGAGQAGLDGRVRQGSARRRRHLRGCAAE